MDLSRNIILEIDLDTGRISTTANTYFYNTDRNIAYFYIKLYTTNPAGEKLYINEANSSQYKVYIMAIKPKTLTPVKLLGERVTNSDIDSNIVYKITVPNELMKQQGFVYCEGQVIYNNQELTTDCFSFKVNPDKLTEYNLTLITDPDLPILQDLISQVKQLKLDARGIDDSTVSDEKTWSSENINTKFIEVKSQIKEDEDNKLTFNNMNLDNLYYLINSNITGDSGSTYGNLRVSSDGKNFNFVKIIPTWTACSSIIHRNGLFYKLDVCSNGTEFENDFVLSTSKNLIDWQTKNISTGFKDTKFKSYGGDFFEDDNGDIYIILSIQDGADSQQTNNDHFSLFIMNMNISQDNTYTFTNYRRLNLDTVNRIDGSILKHNNSYYLTSKREVEGEIEVFQSADLVNWSFINTVAVYSKSKSGYSFEAPYMQYVEDQFVIYADDFGGTYVTGSYNGGMVYTTTSDFVTFSKPKQITNSPNGFRHAQVKKVSDAQEYNIISNLYSNNALTQDIDNYSSKFVNITDRLDGTTLKLLSQSNYTYRMYNSCTIEKLENVCASYFDIVMIGNHTLTLKSSDNLQLPNGVSELVLNVDYGQGTKMIRFTRVDNCYYTDIINFYTLKENIINSAPIRKSYKFESGNSSNITFKVRNCNGLIEIKGHSNYIMTKDRIINAGIGCLNGTAQIYNFGNDIQQISMTSSYSNSIYTFNVNLGFAYSCIDIELPIGSEIIK